MIVSKVATAPDPLIGALSYLPARAAGVIVSTSDGPLRVLGAYVPSRDATLERTERKKRWIEGFHTALDATRSGVPVLLLGDLNVLEPGHQPEHRQQFAPFEYDLYRSLTDRHGLIDAFRHLHPHRIEHSWARRPDLGYRYDHAHTCAQLLPTTPLLTSTPPQRQPATTHPSWNQPCSELGVRAGLHRRPARGPTRMSTTSVTPRVGARVLLLDPLNRVLLIHARDPEDPGHHWWELPGGGLDDGEDLADAARRELAEESGIMLAELGRKLWVRESRFLYRGRAHHRIEHVFLGHTPTTVAQIPLKPTENEQAGLIERRWWPAADLQHCPDKLLPGNLADLLDDLLNDRFSDQPLTLIG